MAVHGPIPQAQFLGGLGIEARLEALLQGASQAEQATLINGFNRLIGGQEKAAQAQIAPSLSGEISSQKEESTQASSSDTKTANDQAVVEQMAEGRGGVEEEGMGFAYKVMAISQAGQPHPIPFL